MTPNHSLALSLELQRLIRTDLLQQIKHEFPFYLIEQYKGLPGAQKRDRVYNDENTLLTMLTTAVQEDKSLQQSVNVFKKVFESRSEQIQATELAQLEQARLQEQSSTSRTGRPRLYQSKLAKSKTKVVSANTAAFTKARQRLPYTLVKQVFDYSADFSAVGQPLWHGLHCFNTDGTYIQMQDSEQLRKKFYVQEGDKAYPQALLQSIVAHGSGQVTAFTIGTRHQSELELLPPLIVQLPNNSLILADDLYNSYAIFALLQHQGCHLIVPGKRDRNYQVLEEIAAGDQLVELRRTSPIPKWWKEPWTPPTKLVMRRITYCSPIDGTTPCVLYTTLLDGKIPKEDLIVKYTSRWDIEITIREIKTIMDINVARSKSEDMVFKEITISLAAYNIVRKIIAKSVEQTGFSPQKDIIQEFTATYKNVLIDKKGRVYSRWSPGRYGQAVERNPR